MEEIEQGVAEARRAIRDYGQDVRDAKGRLAEWQAKCPHPEDRRIEHIGTTAEADDWYECGVCGKQF